MNSNLAKYYILSPNYNPRPANTKIDRITIHCVVGQLTVPQIANLFNKESNASCNYAIGKDGVIGVVVNECNRSWCSSSRSNDYRAVTIEVASGTKDPYIVNKVAYESLLNLVTDICRRHKKKKLLWISDKEKALSYIPKDDEMILTVHRWFANKACPGEFLYSKHSEIARIVTNRLNENTDKPYKVQVGAFRKKENAQRMVEELESIGIVAIIIDDSSQLERR